MQIITVEDKEFDALLEAFKQGKFIGKYWKKGCVQVVCATRQFMLVASDTNPHKIAIKPARNISEAENLALQLLAREEERGNQVQRD
ncbi:MAG: hypothetical protein K1X83_01175 [Oligoflexia bacterium]|nr:hypothetical protein [Oligoflexia bacterium]